MIEGLNNLLEDSGEPGLSELRALLQDVLSKMAVDGQLINVQPLQRSRVYRLKWEVRGESFSIIIKRFAPDRALIEQAALRRWLPIAGLSAIAPSLLGVAAAQTGQWVWHVYEDLGDWTLDSGESAGKNTLGNHTNIHQDRGFLAPLRGNPAQNRLESAIRIIAQVHERFTNHTLLGECRQQGVDLGNHFYCSSVLDAIRALEFLSSVAIRLSHAQHIVQNNLLQKLYQLQAEASWRTRLITDVSGPETLLHGDFGVKNALVLPSPKGCQAYLIDWDHAGVGPVSYDMSTFLVQIPMPRRRTLLDLYLCTRGEAALLTLPHAEWNLLFETAEYARLANRVIWPAISAAEPQHVGWAFADLATINGWFDKLEPVLPLV